MPEVKYRKVTQIEGKALKTILTTEITNLNPTGGVFGEYTPQQRAKAKLGANMTTLAVTADKDPDETVTIYRGASKSVKEIVPGDFITTNRQLAKDYAGNDDILSKQVRYGDIIDDKTESLGEEYIYRPLNQIVRKRIQTPNRITRKKPNSSCLGGIQ